MSFLEHLEELRWHLLRSAIAVLAGMIGVFTFLDEFVGYILLGPLRPDFPTAQLLCRINPDLCPTDMNDLMQLQALSPTEQFSKAIYVGIVGGIIIAFPYIFWEVWRFIRPGLKVRERGTTVGIVITVSLLFFAGVAFAYFILAPFMLGFLAHFQITTLFPVVNEWRIGDVIALITQVCLAGGILFEMPVLAYIFSKLGFLGPKVMRKYRKHAVVFIMVGAGILTPSPDIMSQLLLAVPMYILYEVSILISAIVTRKARKEEEAAQKRLAESEAARAAANAKPPANSEGSVELLDAPDASDAPDTETPNGQ